MGDLFISVVFVCSCGLSPSPSSFPNYNLTTLKFDLCLLLPDLFDLMDDSFIFPLYFCCSCGFGFD
uniref:Uncharacterized protein n=1 Tax=Arundo donax TaxID=35708 RepID=A0A0A9D711_ARUDO